jgi:hypothetical protein
MKIRDHLFPLTAPQAIKRKARRDRDQSCAHKHGSRRGIEGIKETRHREALSLLRGCFVEQEQAE